MKIWKFIVGILLFIAPIGFYSTANTQILFAPIGTAYFGTDNSFAIHSFNWYSENGQTGYWVGVDNEAELWSSFFMMDFEFFMPVGLGLPGIMTIICLYAVALYILMSIIDNEVLNLIADILMIGCTVMSIVAFYDFLNNWAGVFTATNIPIFGIISGVVGLLGFALSIKEMMNPKKRSKRR